MCEYESVEHERDCLRFEVEKLKERLSSAEDLLGEASSALDSMHGYETDAYKEIQEYFEEDEEE